ncbi:ferritin-like fold-containing protein [Marisediminicola sp. LYQ85]|uniref:ferritin-like fold-containing protein n=1 Tax=Marisediminicola sp. LYQ85 TaxID=3391062 RepID=UPI003982D7A1
MASFLRRRAKNPDTPRPRSQRKKPVVVNRVDLAELTPDPVSYLGRAAYVQLALFETASKAAMAAPTTAGKHALAEVSRLTLARYHGLVAELGRAHREPAEAMEPFRRSIDEFHRVTLGSDWYETLVTSYVTAGLLDDFLVRLAGGLSDDQQRRIAILLAPDGGTDLIVEQLRVAIAANPRLASRLAMWGRRLVGDTLLVARSALSAPVDTTPDEARLEPVFTELIAAHTRRMDALGLTA